MAARRSGMSRRTLAGVVLIVLGLLFCGLYRITADAEQHSYAAGSVPPYYVTVTGGHTYTISVHNGVRAEAALGLDPTSLACTLTGAGGGTAGVSVTPEQADTKAVNQIATFVAPRSGRVHIGCTGITAVFVDDADDAAPDTAGGWLLLGVIALTVGVPLGLSSLRGAFRRGGEDGADGADGADGQDDVDPAADPVGVENPASTPAPRPRPYDVDR